MSAWEMMLARAGISLVLVGLAVVDWREGRVPNAGILPLMALALAAMLARVAQGSLTPAMARLVLLVWAVAFAFGALRLYGAGDMKLAMALVALFPDPRLVWMLMAFAFVGNLAMLLPARRREDLRRVRLLLFRASRGDLPDRAEIARALRERGRRVTFVFAAAGVAFLWGVWGR